MPGLIIWLNPNLMRKTNPSRRWIWFGLVSLLCISCLEKLDLEIPRQERKSLHIEAKLTAGSPSTLQVEVNSIFDLTPGSFAPVDVRSVILFDEEDNRIDIPNSGRGTYFRSIGEGEIIQIEVGKSYGLEILTQQEELIVSEMDKLHAVGSEGEVSAYRYERDFQDRFGDFIKQPFIGFDVTLRTPESSDPDLAQGFRFEVERTYRITDNQGKVCYASQLFNLNNEITLTTANLRGASEVTLPVIGVFISSFHAEGFYLNLYQHSLSPQAFQYWNSIQQVLNRNGNMFEAPAGKIRSNFYYQTEPKREIFGLFYTTQTSILRKYISPEFADFPLKQCPPPPPATFDVCNDCLTLSRSQLGKPTFWKEE